MGVKSIDTVTAESLLTPINPRSIRSKVKTLPCFL